MRVRTGGERALAVQGLSPRHSPTPGPQAVVPLRLGSPIRDPAQTAASGGQWRTAVQSWRLSALRLRRITRFLRPPGASPSAGLRAQPDQSTGSSAESQGPVISRPRQGPGPGRGCETRCAGSRPPEGRLATWPLPGPRPHGRPLTRPPAPPPGRGALRALTEGSTRPPQTPPRAPHPCSLSAPRPVSTVAARGLPGLQGGRGGAGCSPEGGVRAPPPSSPAGPLPCVGKSWQSKAPRPC